MDSILQSSPVHVKAAPEVIVARMEEARSGGRVRAVQTKPSHLVRQATIGAETLEPSMGDLLAAIDGLDTDTPRGGEDKGQSQSLSMVPTSDFEEEWRSESEDGDAEQIVQVVVHVEGLGPQTLELRVSRRGVEKLDGAASAALGPKCRRTVVPILIGKNQQQPGGSASQSSAKKVGKEEEAGGGEAPEVVTRNSSRGPGGELGDLVTLASTEGADWGRRRSVSPLRLQLPEPSRRGRNVQTSVEEEGPADKPTVSKPVTEEKQSQTEDDGCESAGREVEVQTTEAEGEDEGTQTIPVAMSQAAMQTDPKPIQVKLCGSC